MFTDIVGYSAMMQTNEAEAVKVRERHREVFNRQHELFHGQIIQYYGDGTLSIFSSAVLAVECAISIQSQLQSGETLVPVRIGLHIGDIVHNNTEVYGDGVNVTARIEHMAIAGSILLSEKINDEIKNHHQVVTKSLGKFELKNIALPMEVYAVTNVGINVPSLNDLPVQKAIQTKSIAVLPFVNMSSSAENEYFSDGMTEEIINALSRIRELRVTSRTSSFFFKNKNIPVARIGEALQVSTILEGSIRLSGNRMRITAQLIDVAGDYHFWSETFDRSLENIFDVQDEISLMIANKLREHIGHFRVDEKLVTAPGIAVESYQHYLKARYHILKMNKPDIEFGIELLTKVVAEHPLYALAYLGIHHGYAMLGTLGLMPAGESFIKGKPFLDKAIELEPDLPECRINLAWISFLQDWDVKAAYMHLENAHAIRPTADYFQSKACILIAEHKFEEAFQQIEISLELDPFSEINYHLLGFINYSQARYEEAIDQFKKSVNLKPDSQVSLLYWGQAILLQGNAEASLAFFQNLPESTDQLLKSGGQTLAWIALGNMDEANIGMTILESALQSESMDRALNLLILCKTMTGRHDEAICFIEKGIINKLPMMLYLSIEPILMPLQAYPRYQELMKRIL